MESEPQFVSLLEPWFTHVGLPRALWTVLYTKIKQDVFDAGAAFSIAEVEEDEEEESKLPPQRVLVASDTLVPLEDVWLIDHAWTFKYRDARSQLQQNEALRQRLAAMLRVPLTAEESTNQDAMLKDVEVLFDATWRVVGSYRPAQGSKALQDMQDSDHDSIWYVMDEVGSAITRSCALEDANVKIATMPVCFPDKGTYSIVWVIREMEASETCIAQGTFEAARSERSADVAASTLYGEFYQVARACVAEAEEAGEDEEEDDDVASWKACSAALEKRNQLFIERSRQFDADEATSLKEYPTLRDDEDAAKHGLTFPLPFYSDSNLVVNFVTDTKHFRLVADPREASIMWMAHYIMHRSDEFPHARFVSQIPEERFFTNKQQLASLVQKKCGGRRPWFQETYGASTELDVFVADFIRRDAAIKSGVVDPSLASNDGTNLWIAKPCNLARSIDMTVSDNLQWLLRVAETGPKIFCKYIAHPATLRGRKFDLRFVVAVRSLQTVETCLEAYLYNVFWTRFASEQYSLTGFDVYAKHWTVMNYADPAKLLQLHYNDFIPEFNEEYAQRLPKGAFSNVWEEHVLPAIRVMLKEMLACIAPDDVLHERFRGSYGVDVMLREERDPTSGALLSLQPTLLEVTFSPDCTRACKYHPNFFNDVFQTLFLGVPSNMTRI